MLQLVVMPIESYNVLIGCCPESSPHYETLKNGFIVRNKAGEREYRLACRNARSIIDFAAKRCPQILPSIRITEIGDACGALEVEQPELKPIQNSPLGINPVRRRFPLSSQASIARQAFLDEKNSGTYDQGRRIYSNPVYTVHYYALPLMRKQL
jgi:hypothetical protein